MPISSVRPAWLAGCALVTLAALGASRAWADTVTVAVAANFSAPMQEIATAFAQDTGHRAELAFGATGKFYAQIVHGAPFGVLLAADEQTPQKIAAAGLGLESSRFTYAIGQLVLWSPQPGYVDAHGDVLKTGPWTHLAIANPKLAPYGAAALQTLDQLGLTASVLPRVVQGENIGQTYQFVASGNAQLGLVALAQVMQQGKIAHGSAWVVPAALHAPLRQDAILLQGAQHNPAAQALLDYLRGARARAIMQAYGYTF